MVSALYDFFLKLFPNPVDILAFGTCLLGILYLFIVFVEWLSITKLGRWIPK
jgi:hypothetical protein